MEFDVKKGLCTSMRGEWSGDVDLNDGKLNKLYTDYQNHLKWIDGLGIDNRKDVLTIKEDLRTVQRKLNNDLSFVKSGKYSVHGLIKFLHTHRD